MLDTASKIERSGVVGIFQRFLNERKRILPDLAIERNAKRTYVLGVIVISASVLAGLVPVIWDSLNVSSSIEDTVSTKDFNRGSGIQVVKVDGQYYPTHSR